MREEHRQHSGGEGDVARSGVAEGGETSKGGEGGAGGEEEEGVIAGLLGVID